MRLEQLHYLITISHCHSMRKASETLHISQQNISKAICNLEDELGVQLFTRTATGCFLTQDGEQVYHLANEICQRTEKIATLFLSKQTLSQYETLKGIFTVATIPGYSPFIYTTLMQLKDLCPKLTFHLEEKEALDVINFLIATQCECSLTTLDNEMRFIDNPDFWNDYEILLLRQDFLKVFTTISSPLLQYQTISDKQLSQYPLITYATASTHKTLTLQLLDEEGIKCQKFISSNSQAIFNEFIIQKKAIAISSDLIFKTALRTNPGNLILLPMTHKIPIVHVYIRKRRLSAAGQVFDWLLLRDFQKFGITPTLYSPRTN